MLSDKDTLAVAIPQQGGGSPPSAVDYLNLKWWVRATFCLVMVTVILILSSFLHNLIMWSGNSSNIGVTRDKNIVVSQPPRTQLCVLVQDTDNQETAAIRLITDHSNRVSTIETNDPANADGNVVQIVDCGQKKSTTTYGGRTNVNNTVAECHIPSDSELLDSLAGLPSAQVVEISHGIDKLTCTAPDSQSNNNNVVISSSKEGKVSIQGCSWSCGSSCCPWQVHCGVSCRF
eukprot:NODE_224_length_1138_cov_1339.405539_g219_i0.p1 GENE.NODE_224_length_1138_cov_1339.405539_g219_i0~~NODE_224_length_1138_cov_1339.405539_g219_i0.p1  ORF type:complete len:232 (+),score=51.23 NODE_224_length_1138_cov_1339.405539_g219_i0:142-837(+)